MRYWLHNATITRHNEYPIIMMTWEKHKIPLLCCGSESLYNIVEEELNTTIESKYLYVIENEDFTSFDYDELPDAINNKKIISKFTKKKINYYSLDDGTVLPSDYVANYHILFRNCKNFEKITNMYDIFATFKKQFGGGWKTPSIILVENCDKFLIDDCYNDFSHASFRYYEDNKVYFTKEDYAFFISSKFNINIKCTEKHLINKQQTEIDVLRNRLTELENKVNTYTPTAPIYSDKQ